MTFRQPASRTNVLAVVGFAAAFLVPVAGIPLGVIAKRQIDRSGENGRGFAIAAVAIGALGVLIQILYLIIYGPLILSLLSGHPIMG